MKLRKLLGVKSPSDEILTPDEHRRLAGLAEAAGVEPLAEGWPSGAPEKPEFKDPPSGWYHFGTHAGWDSGTIPEMEFSEETDDGGMPLWEKPRRWMPVPEPVPPMDGQAFEDVTVVIRDVMKRHLTEHREENRAAESEVKWACNMECIARAVVVWLEQEAERQEVERARESVVSVGPYGA